MQNFTDKSFSHVDASLQKSFIEKSKEDFLNARAPRDSASQVPSLVKLSLFACAKLDKSKTENNYFSDDIETLKVLSQMP